MVQERIFEGDRLRVLRKGAGLTQKTAADKFGISEIGYQTYEAGRRKPSLEVLPKLAAYFRVSTDYLLGLTDEPYPPSKEEWAMIHAFRKAKAEVVGGGK